MKPHLLLACFVPVVMAGPAGALDGPEETVRRLYATEDWSAQTEGPDGLLARDLGAALRRDLATDEPSPAADMDWRYGGAPREFVSAVAVEAGASVPAPRGQTWMDVTVRFRTSEEPRAVVWRLCLARKGWRVADVRGEYTPGAAWSVRQDLGLRDDRVKC
ncbi:MAG: hypothetical protein K1X35_01320 [Caulobacteraceae bacterium]|nr:hypothetical protein [Caulobacteraceae bacterium]